jgi:predicted component of type VI protein secretion system
MKKLYCILGRAPMKNGVMLGNTNSTLGNKTWHIDVDLGQKRKISKQHALIVYNFQTCCFEIKNLSKNIPIKVNGEYLIYNEEMPLSSKSSIIIGNQEFYFLLPI